MHVTVNQDDLRKGLEVVRRATRQGGILPITANVLIRTDGDRLVLTGNNLEFAITHRIPAQVEDEGAITVPAAQLAKLVALLPNTPMILEQGSLRVKAGGVNMRFDGQAAEDFPPFSITGDGISITVGAKALHDAITHVVFAAASDDMRPVLTGVHFSFEDYTLTLAAADGFRLAVYHLPLASQVADTVQCLIPVTALKALLPILQRERGDVTLTIGAESIHIAFPETEMVSQLIRGSCPEYAKLIPQSYTCRAVVDVAEFLRACRGASIIAREESGIVRLIVTPNLLTITAKAEEIGEYSEGIAAETEMPSAPIATAKKRRKAVEPAPITGKIAFNHFYLRDVLTMLKSGSVAVEFTEPSEPGALRPVGDGNYVNVIMPMLVDWEG